MYDSTRASSSVRIVEHLTVQGGKIMTSTFVTDPGPFMSFLGQA